MTLSDQVGEVIMEVIDGIEKVKPVLAMIPPPAGPTIMMGMEYAEALGSFVSIELQRQITDQVIALIRSGVGAGIGDAFKAAYPNG